MKKKGRNQLIARILVIVLIVFQALGSGGLKFDWTKTVNAATKEITGDINTTYKKNFNTDDITGFSAVKGSATIAKEGNTLKVPSTSDAFIVDSNSPVLTDAEVEFEFDPLNDNGKFAAVIRYAGVNSWTTIGLDSVGGNTSNWYLKTSAGANVNLIKSGASDNNADGQRCFANRVVPYKLRVRVVGKVVTIFLDNAEIFNGEVPEITTDAGRCGMRFSGGAGANVNYIAISSQNTLNPVTETITEKTISSDTMTVKVDNAFPRVINYTLTSGKSIKGQEIPYHVVEINNKAYVPNVTSNISGNKATYHMSVTELGVTFDVIFIIRNNVLLMTIENIKDTENNLVKTIHFPNHSLVSVSSTQPGACLKENNYNQEHTYDLNTRTENTSYSATSIAVLNNNEIAATINNDSAKDYYQVAYQTFKNGDHYTTGLWTNEYLIKGIDGEIYEDPWTAVAITEDRNKDGKVDYQDGAIAYRDDANKSSTQKNDSVAGGKEVMSSYTSIAMNVGSAAQYPFLRIADNMKKFYLGTDGFKQTIIIKGYEAEGHDSSHPDFANYNTRAGGIEDFNILLTEAEKYNTNIGVHINETEMYPEAKQYVSALTSSTGGWSWYDSAVQFSRENDILLSDVEIPGGNLMDRLERLNTDTNGKLKIIYVDTYFDTRWASYKLAQTINSLSSNTKTETAIATEYPNRITTSSVWAHHIGGDNNNTGNLVRFIYNSQKDIFGSSNLFRGEGGRVNGFNGWQGASDYYGTMKDFYVNLLPNRFLAQYPMSQWNTDSKAVFGENNEVVSEMKSGVNVITLNGKEVANGSKIFIPWNADGKDRIYHWNQSGGNTTWSLPDSWAGKYTNVLLYKLTSEGKKDLQTISVLNNQVTLTALAAQGYVIYPGTATVNTSVENMTTFDWSSGSPIKDMGFDSHTFDNQWDKVGTSDNVRFIDDNKGNTVIEIKGADGAQGGIIQTMTGLIPGQTYSASAWIKVSSGRKTVISVTPIGGTESTNYIDSSNVIYGVHHTGKYKDTYQRVKLNFTQPEGQNSAVIQIVAQAGAVDSTVYIDDVRVMPVGVTAKGAHYFFEDFENVDQGFGPFESTESDNSHLSEINSETPSITNDVIAGRYSLKVRAGDYMRTLPHRIRLKANTAYTVGIDYKANGNSAFTLGVKSDKGKNTASGTLVLKSLDGAGFNTTKSAAVTFTTGDYDDYYIDITKNKATEYIIDNLYVDEGKTVEAPEYTITFTGGDGTTGDAPTTISAAEGTVIILPKNTFTKSKSSFTGWSDGTNVYQAETIYGVPAKNVTFNAVWEDSGITYTRITSGITATAESEENNGSDGPASYAVDGSLTTLWHSNYSDDALMPNIAENINNGFTINLGKTYKIGKLEYVPRSQENGRITGCKLYYSESETGSFIEVPGGVASWANNTENKTISFTPVSARRLQIRATATRPSNEFISALEFYVYEAIALEEDTFKIPIVSAVAESEEGSGNDGAADKAIDNNVSTYWHSAWSKSPKPNLAQNLYNGITFDLGADYDISKLEYVPRQDGNPNGTIKQYKLYYSTTATGADFIAIPGGEGTWSADATKKTAMFTTVRARRIQVRALTTSGNTLGGEVNSNISAAELYIYGITPVEGPNVEYTVLATASPEEGGTVSGSGMVNNGQTATLTAIPNIGYQFVGWYFGTDKVSSSEVYTTPVISSDVTYIAQFEKVIVIENAVAESEEGSGKDGTAAYAIDNNAFTYWHSAWSKEPKPNLAENQNNGITLDLGDIYDVRKLVYLPRQDKASGPSGEATQTNGTITKYKLYYSESVDGEFLEVTGGERTWTADSTRKTVEFTPISARRLQIRALETMGNLYNYEENTNISGAEFYVCGDPTSSQIVEYTITAQADMGGTAFGTATVTSGSAVSIHATANEGYDFEGWYQNEVKVSDSPTLVIASLIANTTYVARFTKKDTPVMKYYKVTAEALTGGTVTGTAVVEEAKQTVLVAIPDMSYQFEGWYLGITKVSSDLVFLIPAINSDVTYLAKFMLKTVPVPVNPTPSDPTPSNPTPSNPTDNTSSNNGLKGVPIIPDKSWLNISDEIHKAIKENLKDTKKEVVIKVKLGNNETLPTNILNEIRNYNIVFELDMGDFVWIINGKNVENIPATQNEVNLNMNRGNTALIGKTVQEHGVKVSNQIMQFKVSYDKILPTAGTLKVKLAPKYTSKRVYLSSYDEDKNTLEFITSNVVDSEGYVSWEINQTSQYIITSSQPSLSSVLKDKTIYTGKPYTLKVKDAIKGSRVVFSSSNKAVATISKTGKITSKKPGKTVITTIISKKGEKYTFSTVITVKKSK